MSYQESSIGVMAVPLDQIAHARTQPHPRDGVRATPIEKCRGGKYLGVTMLQ